MLSWIRGYLHDRSGANAAEFALVLPVFVLITLGVIHLSFALYASSTLHSAVEAAARCAAVRSGSTCPDKVAIETYAANMYRGPSIGAIFVYSVDINTCRRVTGTGNYTINAGVFRTTLPLTATACHP